MTTGYSGTPLAKKLGLKAGQRTWFDAAMPASVRDAIAPPAIGLIELATPEPAIDVAHIFVTKRAKLDSAIGVFRPLLAPTGFLWVSWPKKAAKMDTDITEQTIRDVALPTGLVDVKVCAVDATWSGLKLVIRKELRST